MRYLSVCSGVGTDHIAWEGLGWECVGFAEIEAFPSAILAHRYPEIRNYGDFTTIPADIGSIDLLVGGTPCQSFSVAGQRAGLDDPRGNLTLEFARLARRLRARWIVWENVPGVLSSDGGRDFAAILTAFRECGYSVCYRVLDAQHFGVPQRRRRVFVVGYLGDDWRPSAEVLLEQASVRGNPQAGSTKGQEVTSTLGGGSGSRGWSCDLDSTTFIPVQLPDISGTVTTTWGAKNATNHEEACSGALVHGYVPQVAPALLQDCGTKLREDQSVLLGGTWWDGTATSACIDATVNDHRMPDKGRFSAVLQPLPFGDMVAPLDTVSQMHVALAARTYAFEVIHQNKANALSVLDYSPSLRAGASHNSHLALLTEVRGDTPAASGTASRTVVIEGNSWTRVTFAHECDDQGACPHCLVAYADCPCPKPTEDGMEYRWIDGIMHARRPTALAVRTAQTGANGIGVAEDVAHTLDGAQGQAIAFIANDDAGDAGPLSPTLRSGNNHASRANGGVMPAVAWTGSESIQQGIRIGTVVRRLTPRECERLQGLPDDWTLVPWRGKLAPDSLRYKAIGNGMAMPVLRWIGERIAMVENARNA